MSEEDDSNGIGFACDFLDCVEEEMKPNLARKATQKEIDSLSNFIGGFEKWSLLNNDCKKEIIKFLDYKSRFKLSICSKIDKEIVQNVPIYVSRIEVKDSEKHQWSFSDEEFDNVWVMIQFEKDYNSGNRFELVFSQSGEDTEIQWLKYHKQKRPETKKVVWKSCNYYSKAVEFVEEWMKKSRFELEGICVEMSKYPMETSQIESLTNCKEVRIGSDCLDDFRWWLQKVPTKLSNLEMIPLNTQDEFIFSSEILALPQIMNTPKIYLWGKSGFTDDQLVNLKAKRMSFDCVNITDDGINRFLKNWVNGKGVDDFRQLLLWSTQVRDQFILTRDLQIRPWDEAFRYEARGFCDDFDRCCGRGLLFQISSFVDPFESLTLCINDDRTSIYATGKKMTWNGETYTDYSIPSSY